MSESSDPRIAEIFAEALLQPVKQRSAFIEAKCAGDLVLLDQIRTLIEADEGTLGGLDKGAILDAAKEVLDQADHPIVHPRQVGPYRIVRKIGEGSSSVVFEAEQERPRRRVALKLMHSSVETRDSVRRFEYEAQLLSLLEYSGIARIYSVGQTEGELGHRCYFSMEYVDGLTIIEHAQREDLSIRARLELFMQVCDAVQYAHQKGVIHRDLKPSNVLITSDGHPKILDFGVAKLLTGDFRAATFRTMTGQIIGTVPYMSPEQARGEPNSQDTRTDVYALGVLLFELLTGELPHESRDRPLHEVIRDICDGQPRRLSQIDRQFSGDLDVIAATAMAKAKERRYQSPEHLTADIRRYLNNEPIEARRPTRAYRLRKMLARNKAVSAMVLLVLVALVTGLSLATIQGRRAEQEAERSLALLTVLETALHGQDRWSPRPGLDETYINWLERTESVITSQLAENPVTLASACQLLGTAFVRAQRLESAEPLLERAVDLRRRFTPNNLNVLENAVLALGELRFEQRDLVGAESLQLSVLEDRKTRNGPSSMAVATAMRELAPTLELLGRKPEAIELLEQSLAICVDLAGATDRRTLDTSLELARHLVISQRIKEADAQLHAVKEAIDAMRDSAPLLLEKWMGVTARKLLHSGEYEQAVALYAELLDSQVGRDATKQERADTMMRMAGVIWAKGDPKKAEPVFKEALELVENAVPENSGLMASLVNSYGVCLRDVGKHAEAEPVLQRALRIKLAIYGEENESYKRTESNLANLYLQTHKYEEAAWTYRRQIKWLQDTQKPGATGLHGPLAIALSHLGDKQGALEQIGEANRIRHLDENVTSWMSRSVINNTAEVYATFGLWDELEDFLHKDHAKVVEKTGPDHDIALYVEDMLKVLPLMREKMQHSDPTMFRPILGQVMQEMRSNR